MGVPNLTQHRQHPSLVALGEAIRSVRVDRGISQENLALLADVDRTHVGRVERGDNNVAFLTLKKLADALEISVAQLMKKAKQ